MTDTKKPSFASITLPTPLDRQGKHYSCGETSLGSVLGFYGVDVREDVITRALRPTPKVGTTSQSMAAYAIKHGVQAEVLIGVTVDLLRAELAAGNPVIVAFQAWTEKKVIDYSTAYDEGHYAVVVGLDENFIYFMDPANRFGYSYLPIPEFEARWHDQMSGQRMEGLAITFRGTRFCTPETLSVIE